MANGVNHRGNKQASDTSTSGRAPGDAWTPRSSRP